MIKIQKNIVIKAPVERVFEFLTTPQNLPEIWPSLVEVTNVKHAPDGTHSFDWAYKMAGLRFRGHAHTIDVVRNQRVVVKNEKGIESVFRYTYSAAEGGGTKLTMDIEYAIPSSLLEKIAAPVIERLNDHEAGTLLQNLKTRLELDAKQPPVKPGKPEKHHPAH
jgi:uncharacterized protein YndB with AHSA1/START domain